MKVFLGFSLIAVGLFVAYLVFVYVAVPIVSFVALLFIGGVGVMLFLPLFKKRKPSLPNETRRAWAIRTYRNEHPEASDEVALEAMTDRGTIGALVALATVVTLAFFVMTDAYQVSPIMYFGFSALLLMLVVSVAYFDALGSLKSESLPAASSKVKEMSLAVLRSVTGLLLMLYAFGILAIKAGIIKVN